MKTWIQTLAVTAAMLSAPLVAQETLGSGGDYARGMMRMADANGDGTITREEWLAASDARFARMDTNGNGVLEDGERPARRFHARADGPATPPGEGSRGDAPPRARGNVTRAQFREDAVKRFDRLDTNHDGKIDPTEMAAAATLARFRNGPSSRAGDVSPPPPPGA